MASVLYVQPTHRGALVFAIGTSEHLTGYIKSKLSKLMG